MPEMQFDFDGLIQLLAQHLYSEQTVFIRELVQNAHDSIQRRRAVDEQSCEGRITISTQPEQLIFQVRDNGIGMNDRDLQEYLSSIGTSGTRLNKSDVPSCIGQFGIGFLSAFVVAQRVEVRTRRLGETQGWLWTNEGRKDYQLCSCPVDQPGTMVTVYLRGPEERGTIHPETVAEVIRQYADMLLVPIYLNDSSTPLNTQHMPWEKSGLTEEERLLDCRLYLEKSMPESVLDVMPVSLQEPVRAEGVLFLTRTRSVGIDIPHTLRLFQNRMFVCDRVPDLLPKWATFVSGIINTPDVTPTAARDNVMRDGAFHQLRAALGNVILRHFESLHRTDPERFSQILLYHHLGIKAACFYHDEFFDQFIHLLLWRTNVGASSASGEAAYRWQTLPEILAHLPSSPGKPQALPCFTERNSGNQYFHMADANGTLVVDASYPFEADLLERFVSRDEVQVRLVRVNQEQDPHIFRPVGPDDRSAFLALTATMGRVLDQAGHSVRVDVRSFQPSELPAIVQSSDRSRARSRARSLMDDPNTSDDLRTMAQDLMRLAGHTSFKVIVNADNPLIQQLARYPSTDPDLELLLLTLYYNALQYHQEVLTPEQARRVHGHTHRLLARCLAVLRSRADILAREQALLRSRPAETPAGARPRHRRVMLLAPPTDRYAFLAQAIRDLVEDHWFCELVLFPLEGEEESAPLPSKVPPVDVLLAEVTECHPMVLYHLGAERRDSPARPTVLLRNHGPDPGLRFLPDLQGLLTVEYETYAAPSLVEYLTDTLEGHPGIQAVLHDPERERFLSPRTLQRVTALELPPSLYRELSRHYPTAEDWRSVTPECLHPLLRDYAPMADVLLDRLHHISCEGRTP